MADSFSGPSIALAHDWLVGLRGGERVLDRLARAYGPTALYTLVANGRPLTPAIDACTVTTSPLQRVPGAAGRFRRHLLPFMHAAAGRLHVGPCDLLVSTSSAVMHAIRPPAGVPHLCYCHSPARYAWEQADDYAVGAGGRLRRLGLAVCGPRFRRTDRRAAQRVTRFLANSRHTAGRIERCWGRDASVVYPPVRTGYFTPDPTVPREGWLLVVSALEPYKRVDVVIDAANRAGLGLRVAGDGTQAAALGERAGPTVEMLGRVDDDALRDLYRRARALVFPQREDFGIVAVEAQACGCPVVALAAGGALETVTSGTGVHFDRAEPGALLAALDALDARPIAPATCRANAERFDEETFDRAIAAHVADLLAGASDEFSC